MASKSAILADTSILIGLQRGDRRIIPQFDKIADSIHISRISTCELIYGSRDKKEKNINKTFLNNFPIIEINEDISQYSYVLLDKYGLKNRFGIADSLLASTSVVNDLAFWTSNMKHFRVIKELTLHKS
ncbi:MAG: PilT protein domain protein [candidate division WWE3 bacterium GW2011_GWC1_41_7]|uniref:PilT protein domain protein n=3 Tax=Katanobacteria TaxID=422282 RepID=A0A0G0XAZ7_UNCKA|nr:MAG: PilT protein domain protein [candidate division WWE3 bacterium GW2011_GWB1_41_6]KKS18804.1 MAG: PilT protein domain protein [candidate division WWE3 bacterium GW2011_GWC1_41_7]KKS22114.1 MAG: PilT protein domain protein [candidate division WWE3 bacterium GW2011_GWA1_41_8]